MTVSELESALRTFGITAVVVAGIFMLIFAVAVAAGRSYLERWARQRLEQELETHRARLDAQTEVLRVQHQRQLRDFQLYTERRHGAYLEAYQSLLRAEGPLHQLWGEIQLGREYRLLAKHEAQELIAAHGIAESPAAEILAMWDSDRGTAAASLDVQIKRRALHQGQAGIQAFRNLQLLSDLYYSSEVRAGLEDAYQLMVRYYSHIRWEGGSGDDLNRAQLKGAVQGAVLKVREVMQRELQRGDYETAATV